MIRDITIGQYYGFDSDIHTLDPRTKLTAALIFIVSLFIITYPPLYIISLIFVIAAYSSAKVPICYMLKGLKGIMILLLFTLIFNALIN